MSAIGVSIEEIYANIVLYRNIYSELIDVFAAYIKRKQL